MSFHDQVRPHCPNSLVIGECDLNKLIFQNPLSDHRTWQWKPFYFFAERGWKSFDDCAGTLSHWKINPHGLISETSRARFLGLSGSFPIQNRPITSRKPWCLPVKSILANIEDLLITSVLAWRLYKNSQLFRDINCLLLTAFVALPDVLQLEARKSFPVRCSILRPGSNP